MKLKFKEQGYQLQAVKAVADCFAGQPPSALFSYKIDPGRVSKGGHVGSTVIEGDGFSNPKIQLSDHQLLENIHRVQREQNLPLSDKLVSSPACKLNLDVEMETGTGKTYCYIRTLFELNQKFGWSKFVVVVPSVAIREGVYKSLQITADHFTEHYGKKARFFTYNSRQLHHLESFSSDAGINVMVINIQAFNATGKDNRRIYDELDDFQSRRPIDVISKNRPILILDEPQKMEGKKTLEALAKFRPLMILRYSATHRTTHNKIHRLDALDAYNQKLVKKIAVRGITVKGLAGTNPYLYLESIEISKKAPVARLEIEVRQGNGIKRVLKRLQKGQDLFVESNELDEYRDGFVIAQIDANTDSVEFTNGVVLSAGDAVGDVTEDAIRRIQIRETIKAHLQKEQQLYSQGIKVLSLFFIDEVVKYRDYSQSDDKGEYARVFEEEYALLRDEYLSELPLENETYRQYLSQLEVEKTHSGYFSIDKKSSRLKDPSVKKRGEEAGLSDDVDAYDLILKDKERLLSFVEPVRFIFSHSALREGWDNPNVFVMCMLKHSDNTISRRQEVGRGLRLCVNQQGDRIDNLAIVHDINVLSVVASESYKDFVGNLQKEIGESLSARPQKATEAYFKGKVLHLETGPQTVTDDIARQIYKYLLKNDYVTDDDRIADHYHSDSNNGTLAALPDTLAQFGEAVFELINGVFSEHQLPNIGDDRKPKMNPLNDNFYKKAFQALWQKINRRATYAVDFESQELINKSIVAIEKNLRVTPLMYTVESGLQKDQITDGEYRSGSAFQVRESNTERGESVHSTVRYDLIGKIAENVNLTRKSVGNILAGLQKPVFGQFKQNPEQFIADISGLINDQKATMVIEKLTYSVGDDAYGVDIFTATQAGQDFSRAVGRLQNHVYDYAIVDSNIERDFVSEMDTGKEVEVFAKLPKRFFIPTPVGNYNPDWAICFKEGKVKHIYFVAETKGSMSSLKLRQSENARIECASKFFQVISDSIVDEDVTYDVVTDYATLLSKVM